MSTLDINCWAVVVAAVANFIIGFMFHGPLFGKTWMRLANVVPTGNEKLSGMVPQMLQNLLANLVYAYALAMVYAFAVGSALWGAGGAMLGMQVGFLIWLGFCVTGSSMDVIWMKASKKLWAFELVSSLVSILAMGAIIGAW